MATLWLIDNASLVSLMTPRSPGGTRWRRRRRRRPPVASRPPSCRFRTVNVLGRHRPSSISRRGRTGRRHRVELGPRRPDRLGKPVVNRRSQDAKNMMQAFMEESRSAQNQRSPARGSTAGAGCLDSHSRFTFPARRPSAGALQGPVRLLPGGEDSPTAICFFRNSQTVSGAAVVRPSCRRVQKTAEEG